MTPFFKTVATMAIVGIFFGKVNGVDGYRLECGTSTTALTDVIDTVTTSAEYTVPNGEIRYCRIRTRIGTSYSDPCPAFPLRVNSSGGVLPLAPTKSGAGQ